VHTYRLNDSVLFKRQNETGTFFNPVTGKVFSVNQVGTIIANFLTTQRSIEEINDHLRAKFDIKDSAVANQSVEKFLYELVSHGLVEEVS